MKYLVPSANVKVLGRAIHSLAKIGDEIIFEPGKDSLALRAVNACRSAYATFTFQYSFFSSIELNGATDGQLESAKCKIIVRSLLLPFRSIAVLDKTVDTCILELEPDQSKMKVHLKCRHNIHKTFSLGLVECETMRAMYSPANCANSWTAQSKMLSEANTNFLSNQEEVTMTVGKDRFRMRNYNEDEDMKKRVHTELQMQPGEFEHFNVVQDASVTFCLKELRSIIMFADTIALPISAAFNSGGEPILFSVKHPGTLEATFVLATLADTPETSTLTTPIRAARPTTNNGDSNHLNQADLPPPLTSQIRPPGRANSTQRNTQISSKMPSTPAATPISRLDATTDRVQFDVSHHLDASHRLDASIADERRTASHRNNRDPTSSSSAQPRVDNRNNDFENEENEDVEDMVQGTPPSKKFKRFMLARCFEQTFDPRNIPGNDNILAPDSDED